MGTRDRGGPSDPEGISTDGPTLPSASTLGHTPRDEYTVSALGLIAGRYQPVRVLGVGGMGRVIEAEDRQTGARVALKLPVRTLDGDPRAQARFIREAQAAAMLDHPNVVRVLDVVATDDGTPAMVLELLEGDTLASQLRMHGRLSLAATAAVLEPVLSALAEAHQRGLVHRDFKPDNIFLAKQDGRVIPKLLDFGITKVLHDSLLATGGSTSLGEILGTPDYMAPEQVCGEAAIDARVDVWAAGVVVYECLAGVRPFAGANVGQVLRAILLQPPVPLASLVDELPVDVAIAVGDTLDANVDLRPRDLGALLCALRAHRDDGIDADSIADAGVAKPTRAGQRRPVIVLVGLFAERGDGDPQRAFRMSAALREQARGLATDCDAKLVEHPGVGIALVFGLGSASSSDALRSLHAADRLHRAATDIDDLGALRIGVAHGHVVVGTAGTEIVGSWSDASAWRTAAALAKQAEPGTTRLDEGVERVVARPQGRPIGRRRELWRLAGLLDECVDQRHGAVVLLRGEAGIGKTTLARALMVEGEGKGLRCLAASIFDFGAHPELDVARGLFGDILLEHRRVLADEHRLVLDELLRLPASEQVQAERRALEPELRKRLRGAGMRRLLELTAAERPLLLWVDDVHWADEASLVLVVQLLEAVGSGPDRLPVVLLMTTRPVEAPNDPRWRSALAVAEPLTIDLGPLSEHEALALARRHVGTDTLARRCVERANGNPLFLLSIIQDVDAAGGNVPASVDSIVVAKLDRLAVEAQAVVHAAAVLGRRFAVDALDHMVPGAQAHLSALVHAELLEPDFDAYLFRHDLVRDAVYGSLVAEVRTALHRRAAEWYRGRDRLMVARHLDSARDPAAAAAYLEAAREERAIQRLASALALARRGEQLADDEALGCELGLLCGELECKLGLVADSLTTFRALVPRARTDEQRFRAYLGQAEALNLSERNDEALAVLTRASATTDDPALLTPIHRLRGNIWFTRGDADQCLREHRRAHALARELGDGQAEARALSGIADANYLIGGFTSALENHQACAALSQREGMLGLEALSHAMSVVCRVFGHDIPGAVEASERAIELAERAMDAKAQVLAGTVTAQIRLERLELDACERDGGRGLAMSRRVGTLRLAQYALMSLGWSAELRGLPELAMRRFEEAADLAAEVGEQFIGAGIRAGLAALDPSRAEALLDEGEAILARGGMNPHNGMFFHAYGLRAAYMLGDAGRLRRFADALDGGAEPTAWRELHAARGRALADLVEGQPGAVERIASLRAIAVERGLAWVAGQLDAVLQDRNA